jgi:hypothetical protein
MVRHVLTADVRFEGWTSEDWQRFLSIWEPRATGLGEDPRSVTRPQGGLFVIHDGARVRKLLHTGMGRLPPPATWPMPLEELCALHQASWVVSGRLGALDEVMERFGARARRDDDLTRQALSLVGIVREMTAEGALDRWPVRLRGLPTPTEGMVQRALDSLCAPGKAIVLGLFKDGELWTAFVATRRKTAFDVIAGPDELRPAMGLLSGDFRRDYRHLVQAVERRYAPLALGCFGEASVLRELSLDGRPGAWSRAVAVRDLVLSPVPAAVGLALGFDSARFAYSSLKLLTSRIDPLGLVEPSLVALRRRLGRAAGNKDIENVLGFDPIAALRALLRR